MQLSVTVSLSFRIMLIFVKHAKKKERKITSPVKLFQLLPPQNTCFLNQTYHEI